MRYLQVLNAFVTALGAAFAVVLGVVCILYLANLQLEPRLRADLPKLLAFTGAFALLGGAGGAAFVGHRRAWVARWLLQALPLAPLVGVAVLLLSLRGA